MGSEVVRHKAGKTEEILSPSEIKGERKDQMAKEEKVSAEEIVRDIRRQTRRKYNAEEKIRIVLEGLRGEASVAELCRREGINPNLYYKWSKEFLEAGKTRLTGDSQRQATSSEVEDIRRENEQLKQVVAELLLKNRVLKKSMLGRETSEWDE
jgi:transposase